MIPLRDSVPAQRWPVVTWMLVGVNVWMFLYEVLLGPELETFIRTWGFVPARYFWLAEAAPGDWAGRFTPILTSMFLHGGWMHLIGNMLYLWIFGDNVEDSMGHVRFLIFYLLSGIAAVFAQALPDPGSQIPMIGASGAISGVLGGYLLLYPHARVLVLIPLGIIMHTVRLPAGWVLALWFGLQLLSNLMSDRVGGGVAFRAHIGGFIAGMILVPLFKHRNVRLWNPPRYR